MINKTHSLKDEVYSRVMEDIFSSTFKPNQILTEKQLIERYGCSKAPIREALISLCDENVLRNIPRYGYEVVRLTDDYVKEIMEFRWILESSMLTKICEYITDKQIRELEEINVLCNSTNDDLVHHWRYNMVFHVRLISYSRNEYATSELEKAMNILWRAYAQFYWNEKEPQLFSNDMRMHAKLIDALYNRDETGCRESLHKDLNDFLS